MYCYTPISKATSTKTVPPFSKHSIPGSSPAVKLVGSPSSSEIKFSFTVTFLSFLKIVREIKNSNLSGCLNNP
jgi:hypothetical protein